MPPDPLTADASPAPLELWCAYPDDLLDGSAAAACSALITPEEQTRWERLRFAANRREFLATRALVRTTLSHHRPLPPVAWRFHISAHGKPEIDPACGLTFNLSNAPGLAVCLLAHGAEVGVDVEPHSRAAEIVPLASNVFSPREQAQLLALPAEAHPDRALSLWTLKEAYIKARGLGLSLPLKGFSFVFGGDTGIRLEIDPALGDEPGRWRFRLLDHAGHRIALITELATAAPDGPVLEFWESRLTAAPPRQIPLPSEPWLPISIGR